MELIILAVLFAGLFLAQEYRHSRDTAAWQAERADLLQRIQAPEAAVVTHTANVAPDRAVRAAGFDDDDDVAAAVEGHAGA